MPKRPETCGGAAAHDQANRFRTRWEHHDPIDVEAEDTHAALWLGALILFLASAWFAWDELRYLIRGNSVEAQVLRTYQVSGRSGVSYYVEYGYQDADGRSVTDSDGISADWQKPLSGKVKVTYIPGEMHTSRLAGHRQYVPVAFFLACLAALGYVGIKWFREGEKVARYLNRKDD